MARIPLAVASRGLDTGSVVSYPSGSPVGAALANFGDAVSGVADHFRRKQEQKDAFDATIREQEMSAELASLEDQAAINAPADASGLHDSVYGQIDPETNTAVKPGSFDALFDSYLERMPESRRQEFAAKREVYRLRGSNRLAAVQYQGEQRYYGVEIQKAQNQITNAMAALDPNDVETFESFKKQGLDIIDKSGLPALEKDVAKANWEANASETLFKTKLAKDPAFAGQARAALGLAPPPSAAPAGDAVGSVVDRIIGVESGGNPTAKNPNSSATGAGQFINSTWLATIKKHRPDIAAGKSRAELLALRNDGALSREMVVAHTRDNAEYLTNRAVPITPGNLYLAHFAGSAGAVQVLKADPGASVAAVLGQDKVKANPFLAGMTASDLVAWANKKMGGPAPQVSVADLKPDPAFANIPLDRRIVLANQADVQVGEAQRQAVALANAEYTAHKDALELQIVQGQVKDESLISNDGILNDGDKATLIRSVRTQNETANQIQADLSALAGETLTLDPYAAKDKTRADNLYADAAKRLPAEQRGAVAASIVQQTGIVPAPVVNAIRKGLNSTNIPDIVRAAQAAARIAAIDPAALARREGGAEAQAAADDFGLYVNKMNLEPEEAAQRIADANDPEKKVQRKAIEPAAKEFVKEMEEFDLAGEFNNTWFGGDPDLGFSPGQALGIQAEFLAIAEDQFYASNGDAEVAQNRAVEQMKRLYGTTEVTGRRVVMKHPPENYWPKSAIGTTSPINPNAPGAPSLDYAWKQLQADIAEMTPTADMDSVQLVTTPETDAMVKRGEMPGYAVLYKDENGVLQTIPGKLWRPDLEAAKTFDAEQEDERINDARAEQVQQRQQAPYRVQTPEDFLSGNDPVFGAR